MPAFDQMINRGPFAKSLQISIIEMYATRAGGSMSYQTRIQELEEDICRYKQVDQVTIIGVTKTLDIKDTEQAIKAGLTNLGENRLQNAQPKIEALSNRYPSVSWHFIGRIQKNKLKKIVYYFQYIHSISDWDELSLVNSYSEDSGKQMHVLLQVNTSGEDRKQGFTPEHLSQSIHQIDQFEHIHFSGYMTMAPYTEEEQVLRDTFGNLKAFADSMSKQGIQYEHLSMGMSNDYRIALQEGATMIRIGTYIFS